MKKSVLLLLICSSSVFAHEKTLSVMPGQVRAGEQVQVRGAGLGANLRVILSLEGASEVHSLGELPGDAHGQFQSSVTIPAKAKPGAYSVIARANGNRASAAVKVLQAGPASAAPSGGAADHAAMGHIPATQTPAMPAMEHEVSIEPLRLDRSRTAAESAAIWIAILLSAVTGTVLWIKR